MAGEWFPSWRLRRWIRRAAPDSPRLRHALRRIARRLGLLPPVTRIAAVLEEFALHARDVTFVQIGSNDATHGDPLRWLVREWGWRGVMVEPVPHVFRRLQERWGHVKGLALVNAAVGSTDGSREFFHPRPDDDPRLPPWYDQIGSFRRDVVLKEGHVRDIPDLHERLVATNVECLTFQSLCRRLGVQQVDLIHIDAEGSDWEILGTIDLDACGAQVVLFEHKHLAAPDSAAARDHLARSGFRCMSEGPDTLAVRAGLLARLPAAVRSGPWSPA